VHLVLVFVSICVRFYPSVPTMWLCNRTDPSSCPSPSHACLAVIIFCHLGGSLGLSPSNSSTPRLTSIHLHLAPWLLSFAFVGPLSLKCRLQSVEPFNLSMLKISANILPSFSRLSLGELESGNEWVWVWSWVFFLGGGVGGRRSCSLVTHNTSFCAWRCLNYWPR